MDLQMRKYQLIQELVNLKDIQLLDQLEAVIKSHLSKNEDWSDGISTAERNGIISGIRDHEEGRVYTNEEVRKELNDKFGL